MMNKKISIIIGTICFTLSACGTLPGVNSDVPNGIYTSINGRPKIDDTAEVKIVSTGPTIQQGSRIVVGISCKNKLWDPSPSRDNAINLMKKQASEKGFNTIHSVEVKSVGAAVAINCWSALKARGLAFNSAKTQ